MCLIAVAWRLCRDYPLVVIANRDEFHDRRADAMHEWPSRAGLFAGRDRLAGGTWLGATVGGRFAAVTNYREGEQSRPGDRSRGEIVVDSLTTDLTLGEFLGHLRTRQNDYSGFNLIVGDGRDLFWYSNRAKAYRRLEPGIHGLSNGLLNDAWPKVRHIKTALAAVLDVRDPPPNALLNLLAHRRPAAAGDLPDTGLGVETERWLSSVFILGERYGTRASSLYMRGADGVARLYERRFDDRGQRIGEDSFRFRLHSPRQSVN